MEEEREKERKGETYREMQRERGKEQEEKEVGKVSLFKKSRYYLSACRRDTEQEPLCQVLKGWGQVRLDANIRYL